MSVSDSLLKITCVTLYLLFNVVKKIGLDAGILQTENQTNDSMYTAFPAFRHHDIVNRWTRYQKIDLVFRLNVACMAKCSKWIL